MWAPFCAPDIRFDVSSVCDRPFDTVEFYLHQLNSDIPEDCSVSSDPEASFLVCIVQMHDFLRDCLTFAVRVADSLELGDEVHFLAGVDCPSEGEEYDDCEQSLPR